MTDGWDRLSRCTKHENDEPTNYFALQGNSSEFLYYWDYVVIDCMIGSKPVNIHICWEEKGTRVQYLKLWPLNYCLRSVNLLRRHLYLNKNPFWRNFIKCNITITVKTFTSHIWEIIRFHYKKIFLELYRLSI